MFGFRLSLSVTLLALAAMAIVAAPRAGEQEGAGAPKAVKLQTTCPVGGEKISKASYADHEGHRVYFCCDDCKAEFKKNPAASIKKMQDQGITVAKLQTDCPVMGGAINKSSYVDRNGKRIYLCCDGCKGKVTDARIAELEAQGIVFESLPAKE
jgi:YHS domain-containing protein